jgi:riboflavin kinase / FMN adenylyltransferase
MQILRDDLSDFDGETILTIGKFDGIHIAHQQLIRTIQERSRALGVRGAVVTFDPHPAAVLSPESAPLLLTPLPEKIALLDVLGLDLLVLLTFNREMMQTRAADFLQYLTAGLRPRELWVGEDFAMGYRREGNVDFIRKWTGPRGIEVQSIPLVSLDGKVVSGSTIRELIMAGEVEASRRLLGRPPGVSGVVHRGDQRGRSIGFPTANILPEATHLLPANGVYASRTRLASGEYVPSVTNVGTRPTFNGQRRQVETHLLDWSGDLYDETILIQFLHRLREEKKFSGIEMLRAQIGADVAQARELLLTEQIGEGSVFDSMSR